MYNMYKIENVYLLYYLHHSVDLANISKLLNEIIARVNFVCQYTEYLCFIYLANDEFMYVQLKYVRTYISLYTCIELVKLLLQCFVFNARLLVSFILTIFTQIETAFNIWKSEKGSKNEPKTVKSRTYSIKIKTGIEQQFS